MDGSGSFDPDGDPLTYMWAFTSKPNWQHRWSLDDDSLVMPMFTPDEEGTYVLELIVKDGELNSDPDTVVITTETGFRRTRNLSCGSLGNWIDRCCG